jgi:4-amino-4-deoxy-L-arabinose transferase-like glycosyltransferase
MELKPSLPAGRTPAHRSPFWLWIFSVLWLLLLCWLAFFNNLGSLGLMDKTEALFVEVGNQMLKRGDWITPWWNGERFFDYPVWGYWMVAISFQLFGVSEWAARLPVALAASSVVVAAFALLVLWPPPEEELETKLSRAAIASGVLATTPGWIGWGRTSTTDMFLSSAITLALFGFLLAHRHSNNLALVISGRISLALFSGIAVLAKGPVGLVVPALVIGSFLTISGQWRRWLRPIPVLGMVTLFLAVCLPWYAAATKVNGMDFLWGFLGFSNIQRFTSVIYNHPGPPWFYIPWVILLLLPWSLFLPVAVGSHQFWKLERWRPVSPQQGPAFRAADPLPLFLLLWFLLTLALFSAAATKLAGYILPALPPCSLLVALYWRPLPDTPHLPSSARMLRQGAWPLRLTGWFNVVLFALMAAAAVLAPKWVANDPAYPDFSSALNRSGLPLTLSFLLALTALGLVVVMLRQRRGAGSGSPIWLGSWLFWPWSSLHSPPCWTGNGSFPCEHWRIEPARQLCLSNLSGWLARSGTAPFFTAGFPQFLSIAAKELTTGCGLLPPPSRLRTTALRCGCWVIAMLWNRSTSRKIGSRFWTVRGSRSFGAFPWPRFRAHEADQAHADGGETP